MAVPLYMDVHVPSAITVQLRRRGVDVLSAQEADSILLEDCDLLESARMLGRLMFTQDVRFRAMAEAWQRQHRPFAGLVFGPQLGGTIGQYVRDLELICTASDLQEWADRIEWLPF